MRRTLLITNDFPPRIGGIQSYLYELVSRLDPGRIVVFAPRTPGDTEFDAAQRFPVVRHRGMLLPTPAVARTARRLLAEHATEAVWFGAAAPLGLLAPALRVAGARRILASTHGHEVGWSMLPGARAVLRGIGTHADVITYVSGYTRKRIAAACGPRAALEHLPPGVDTTRFAPDPLAGQRIRACVGLTGRRVILCVSRLVPRKGQDTLIRAMPSVLRRAPDAALLIVGDGRDKDRLRELARPLTGDVVFAPSARETELPAWYNAADVFAMPCRTRGFGLDVEGLGIVFLEAAASGLAVIAGDSGGAPETVLDARTGLVVPAREDAAVAEALLHALRRADFGPAGREWMRREWTWSSRAAKLASLLDQ